MCIRKVYHENCYGKEACKPLAEDAGQLANATPKDQRRNGHSGGHTVADVARLEVRRTATVAGRKDAAPDTHVSEVAVHFSAIRPPANLDGTTQAGYTIGMNNTDVLPGGEWRPVVGLEERYEVSNVGRIRRIMRDGPPRLLKPVRHPAGYLHVNLSDGGRRRRSHHLIHRLVATAFIGPCPENYECNHKNGDKTDNRVENLEWCSHKENMLHAVQTGLKKMYRGRNGQFDPRFMKNTLTEENVRRIHALYAESKHDAPALASMFGVTCEAIRRILIGSSWKHLDLTPVWRRDGTAQKRRLAPEKRAQIKRLYETGGYSQESLARAFGIGQRTVSRIVRESVRGDIHGQHIDEV